MPTSKNKRKNGKRVVSAPTVDRSAEAAYLMKVKQSLESGRTILTRFEETVAEKTATLEAFVDRVQSEAFGKAAGEETQASVAAQAQTILDQFRTFPLQVETMKTMIDTLEDARADSAIAVLQGMMNDLSGFNAELNSAVGAVVSLESTVSVPQ